MSRDPGRTPNGARYPAHWEADVVLADGGTAHLRPIRPGDADGLRALVGRVSAETLYLRFFSRVSTVTDAQIEHFVVVDQVHRVALVAVIGGDLVAVGRYEGTAGSTEAEVAFLVEDAHQGRGFGSVLLEHLAAAAAERGVERFVADVLTQNDRMISVFLDAGYLVEREYDSGTVRLAFDIAPTAQTARVALAREHRAEARSIARLLRPRAVAVVGASRDPRAVGHVVLRNLLASDFTGPVYAVNPAAVAAGLSGPDTPTLAGAPVVASIAELPEQVDLVVVAVPVGAVVEVARQCAAAGVHGLVVHSGSRWQERIGGDLGVSPGDGLGPAADDGGPDVDRPDAALVAVARAGGMRVVGPSSLGLINTAIGLDASLAAAMPPTGRVGVYSQSGALGFALLAQAARTGVSSFVSAGDRADVSGNDLLQFWEDDPATDVAVLSIESFGNPRKFARIARRVGRRLPVIVRTIGGGAYDAAAYDEALLRQAGVIHVGPAVEAFGVADLLVRQPLPAGRRVGIVADAGAPGRLAVRACAAAGLEPRVVTLPADSPVDSYAEAFEAAARDADVLLSVVVPAPWRENNHEVGAVLAAVAARTGRTTLATVLGTVPVPAELGPVPAYPTPQEAVQALVGVLRYAEWRARPPGRVPALDVRTEDARRLVEVAGGSGGGDGGTTLLGDAAAADLLACYGIRMWPSIPVVSAARAVAAGRRLGWPVALKAAAAAYRHRVDLGGVRLDIADPAEMRAAWAQMTGRLAESGYGGPYVVQAMAPPGVAVVVGSREDPTYGPVVSFALGGVASQLLGDVAHHIVPLTTDDAARLVRGVRAAPLLSGYRGAAPVDIAAVEDLLLRVSRLADDVPAIASLSLNPVVAGRAGVAVLGAEVVVGPPRPRGDIGPRRLRASADLPRS